MAKGAHNTARALIDTSLWVRERLRMALVFIEGSQPDGEMMRNHLSEARGYLSEGCIDPAAVCAKGMTTLARDALIRYQQAEQTAYCLAADFDKRRHGVQGRIMVGTLVREALAALDTLTWAVSLPTIER